jgi:tetratricopeptide (TPR) repeat protein
MATDFTELWDFSDPAASELRFRQAAQDADDPSRTAERLEALTQVARALGLQGRYDEARAVLGSVEDDPSRSRLAGAASYVVQSRLHLERGRVHRSSGAVGPAAECFEDAAVLAREAGDVGLEIDALHMQVVVETVPEAAVRLSRRALRLARSSQDPAARRWEASLLNNLGCALVDAGQLDQALSTFTEAVDLRARQGQRRETQIGRWMVAWTLRLLGRDAEALAEQRALKDELVADGVEDPYVDEEIALLEARRTAGHEAPEP